MVAGRQRHRLHDLRRALEALGPDVDAGEAPDHLLGRLDDGAAATLALAVVAAYYAAPEVRRAIGYPGQEARAVAVVAIPDYLDEGLLDHVAAAG